MTIKGKISVKVILTMFLTLYLTCLSVLIPDTNAHLKDVQVARGYNRIGDLKVWIADDGAGTLIQLPENSQKARKVEILNKGEEVMFVRLLIQPVLTTGTAVQKAVDVTALLPDFDLTTWIAGEDGYYYSLAPLTKEGTSADTLTVFTQVKGTSGMTNQDRLGIEIKAEAITARGDTYRKAWWNNATIAPGSALKVIDDALQGEKL